MVAAIGVLALVGAYHAALSRLRAVGENVQPVRYPAALSSLSALVVPSAVPHALYRLLAARDWRSAIHAFVVERRPLWMMGAAALLFAQKRPSGDRSAPVPPALWPILPLVPEAAVLHHPTTEARHFTATLSVPGITERYAAIFLSAPSFPAAGYRDDPRRLVRLSKFAERIVLLEWEHVLFTAFSPEFSDDPVFFRHFVERSKRA